MCNVPKTIEFTVLWTIALSIVASLRLLFRSFMPKSKNNYFSKRSGGYFCFCYFSIYVLIKRMTDVTLEGWVKDEN